MIDEDLPGETGGGLSLLVDALSPMPPPADIRERLLANLAGPARYLPFVAAMGRVFDLDLADARALLVRASDRTGWARGQAPFLAHLDFAGGPRCGKLRAGFVVMAGDSVIPRHRHTDPEVTLVLEGGICSEGRRYVPGDVLEMSAASEHVFEVAPEGAVFAVLRGRVEFLG